MKQLILLLVLFYTTGVQAQEYTDTVEIVDFLESAIRGEERFKQNIPGNDEDHYVLENTVILIQITDYDASGNIIRGISKRLKHRLPDLPTPVVVTPNLILKRCRIASKAYKDGDGYSRNTQLAFIELHFKSLVIDALESESGHSFRAMRSTFERFQGFDLKTDFRFQQCKFNQQLFLEALEDLNLQQCVMKQGAEFEVSGNLWINRCKLESKTPDTLQFFDRTTVIINPWVQRGVLASKFLVDTVNHALKQTRGSGAMAGFNQYWVLPDTVEEWRFLQEEPKVVRDYLSVVMDDAGQVFLGKNEVYSEDDNPGFITMEGTCRNLTIVDNEFPVTLSLKWSRVEENFNLSGNTGLRSVALDRMIFSEFRNYVSWNDVGNFRLLKVKAGSPFNEHLNDFYNGRSLDLHDREDDYNKLIEVYYFLYRNYKDRGNTLSANRCYAEMKTIETVHWNYLHQQNKNFESFFRWWLNVFLNYFTDYGTNPAKAVIKSAWVVLLFSIFYLFFPSDWDVTNRSQLMKRMRELFSRNREKSLGWTLGFVLYSGFIHLMNAITLSLNAFTTLGFGDIPTHGAARYVTIIQGFIGWFLLTIFSVSLINQVLA